MADELIELRQKSITDFLVSGGQPSCRSLPSSNEHYQSCPKSYCHPLNHVLHNKIKKQHSLSECMNDLSISRVKACDLTFQPSQQFTSRDIRLLSGVNTLEFDHQGVLFVAGGSSGVLRVFDLEECMIGAHLRWLCNMLLTLNLIDNDVYLHMQDDHCSGASCDCGHASQHFSRCVEPRLCG